MNSEDLQKYIIELEKQKADNEPLCKTKKSKQPPEVSQSEAIVKVKKTRAPKTQKQLDAFNNIVLEKRKKMVEQRQLEKKIEASKLLLANEMNKPKPQVVEHDSDSSEDEIIIKPKKKKSKKIVIEDSSSESEDEVPLVHNKKDFGRSHCNKKSAVKIHEPVQQNQQSQQPKRNFFCD